MKTRPIRIADCDHAADILARGFPRASREFWGGFVERLFAYCTSIGRDSVGQFIEVGAQDVGICIAIPAGRSAYLDTERPVLNLSSFYLEEKHQWMTPLVMRRLTADRSLDYVDVTASPSMRQINRKLGFSDRSEGAILVPLPPAALRPARGNKLIAFSDIPHDRLEPKHRTLLDLHAELGCICAAIEAHGQWHPLVFSRNTRRGVPGARVILARDRQLVRDALGPIARHLLGHGIVFLEYEGNAADRPAEAVFWRYSPPYQVLGDLPDGAIDHTFSELVFLQAA